MSGSARFALALAVVLGSGGAVAQPVVPAAVATTPERSGHHPHAGLGAGLTVGLARSSATDDGWVARLDYDVLPVLAPRGTFGGVFGFAIAGELWKAGEDWGLGLPFAMALGVRGRGFRAVGLLGWETFLVDSVADDTGVGFFAPLAGVRAGLDLAGWQLGADVRVIRRWQFGADDLTQWQVGVFLSHIIERTQAEPLR
ncbi:MAG: hypothetical protein KBG48_15830 [Kofleriaceae bacterium]|jgi:hypothetical protein|nr:hypothetical protein [Kofleriaceae bacterium]MBP9168868.1 hypothetical protein [Kofleriaceae bacterium]MBP9862755.1 hypothetical protein [Kofleriaceae bacterium]